MDYINIVPTLTH